jgi:hypothetical protein
VEPCPPDWAVRIDRDGEEEPGEAAAAGGGCHETTDSCACAEVETKGQDRQVNADLPPPAMPGAAAAPSSAAAANPAHTHEGQHPPSSPSPAGGRGGSSGNIAANATGGGGSGGGGAENSDVRRPPTPAGAEMRVKRRRLQCDGSAPPPYPGGGRGVRTLRRSLRRKRSCSPSSFRAEILRLESLDRRGEPARRSHHHCRLYVYCGDGCCCCWRQWFPGACVADA